MSSSNTCIPIFSCCGASFSWRLSCHCLALNWPFLTWPRFGCFKLSLFFLLTSSPNFSRHRLWTISQNALSCFAVDPLRHIVRVVESSWSSRAQAELWFPLGHWILTLLGNAPGCAGQQWAQEHCGGYLGSRSHHSTYLPEEDCVAACICVLVGCVVQAGWYGFYVVPPLSTEKLAYNTKPWIKGPWCSFSYKTWKLAYNIIVLNDKQHLKRNIRIWSSYSWHIAVIF